MSAPEYSLEAALERLQQIQGMTHRPMRLTIRKCNPGGLSGHQTVAVKTMGAGCDWEGGQVVIEPEQPLTVLTPEQVADITASVRKGQSWHAYEAQKKLRAQIDSMKALNAELLDALKGAPVLSAYHGAQGFDAERFISAYEAWVAKKRAAIAKAGSLA